MGVVKVVELVGESNQSWEDAVRQAVREASKTVRNISGVEVRNWTGNVDHGEITEYKADVQVAFAVETMSGAMAGQDASHATVRA